MVKALLWFHPLVWLAHRQLIASQEQACDQYALTFGIEPEDYASDLLRSASHSHTTPSQALAMARWSQIGNRIRHILNAKNHHPTTMKKITSLCTVVSLSAIVIASIGFAQNIKPDVAIDSDKDTAAPKFLDPKKASSKAIVQIHPGIILTSPIGEFLPNISPPNYVEEEFKALVSSETLKIAAKTLKIDLEKNKDALANLKRKISTKPRRGTDFIEITVQDTDKKEATRIANAVVDAYIKNRSDQEMARAKEALTALDNELIVQSELVQQHRKDLTTLIQKHGIPYFEGNNKNPLGATEADMFRMARKKLSDFKTQRDQIKIQIKTIEETKNKELVKYVAGLNFPENQVTQYFLQHETAMKEKRRMIATGLAEGHPDVIASDKKAKSAMENAKKETLSVKAVLKTQLQLVERQVARMEEMLADRSDDSINLSLKQEAYNKAKESYEQSRTILRETKTKQEEARVLLKMPRSPVTLHERAK